MTGFEPATSCSPSTRSHQAELHPELFRPSVVDRSIADKLSGRQDLNLRPPGSEPGALPGWATSRGRRGRGRTSSLRIRSAVLCPFELRAGMSRRQDSNLRPPGSKPGALPDCATPRRYAVVRDPTGARIPVASGNVRTSLRGGRAARRRGCGRSLGDGPRLPLGSGRLAHHRRVPTPRPGRSPRRERQTARAKRTHGERQTSAGLELELRPMDVACRVHDCLRGFVCTPREQSRQAVCPENFEYMDKLRRAQRRRGRGRGRRSAQGDHRHPCPTRAPAIAPRPDRALSLIHISEPTRPY